jgi:hypothetical protein
MKLSLIQKFPFPERFVCGEENQVLTSLKKRGYQFLWDSSWFVFHERRPGWFSFAKQVFKYGAGRAQNMKLDFLSIKLAHLIPAFFLSYLAVLILFSKLLPPWFFLPLAMYAALSLLSSAKVIYSEKESFHFLPILAILFFTIHFSYGAGVIWALLRMGKEPVHSMSTEFIHKSKGV